MWVNFKHFIFSFVLLSSIAVSTARADDAARLAPTLVLDRALSSEETELDNLARQFDKFARDAMREGKYVAQHLDQNAQLNSNGIVDPISALTPKVLAATIDKIRAGRIALPPQPWVKDTIFRAFYESVAIDIRELADPQFAGLYIELIGHVERLLNHEGKFISIEERAIVAEGAATVIAGYAANQRPKKIDELLSAEARATLKKFYLFYSEGSPRNHIWKQWPLFSFKNSDGSNLFSVDANPELSRGVNSRYNDYFIANHYTADELLDGLQGGIDVPAFQKLPPNIVREFLKIAIGPKIYDGQQLFFALRKKAEELHIDQPILPETATKLFGEVSKVFLRNVRNIATRRDDSLRFPTTPAGRSRLSPKSGVVLKSTLQPHTLRFIAGTTEPLSTCGNVTRRLALPTLRLVPAAMPGSRSDGIH